MSDYTRITAAMSSVVCGAGVLIGALVSLIVWRWEPVTIAGIVFVLVVGSMTGLSALFDWASR